MAQIFDRGRWAVGVSAFWTRGVAQFMAEIGCELNSSVCNFRAVGFKGLCHTASFCGKGKKFVWERFVRQTPSRLADIGKVHLARV
jgi:hypothetical protein